MEQFLKKTSVKRMKESTDKILMKTIDGSPRGGPEGILDEITEAILGRIFVGTPRKTFAEIPEGTV